ncbi:MAG: hypothetical protein R3D85_07395 [Paracoccaceae bacterium]
MKPNFALSLSFEGIGLLHRAFPGWNRVGEVALDSPDLGGALAVLRETAEQIAGPDFTTKLVIPNDQIKYLALDLGPMAEADRSSAIRTALEGATPYPVDELEFDWSVEGDQTLVAAVARETLSEAESFARAHGFAPLSFVATPPGGQFSGEPFFGQTRHAETLLAEGGRVQRDMVAIRVTGVARLPDPSDEAEAVAPPPPAEPEAAPEAPEPQDTPSAEAPAMPEPEQAATDEDAPASDDTAEDPEPALEPVFGHAEPEPEPEPEPEVEPEPAPETDAEPAPEPAEEPAPEPEAEPLAAVLSDTLPDDGAPADDIPPASEPVEPVAAFASMRAQRDDEAGSSAPALAGVSRGGETLTAPTIPIDPSDDDASWADAPVVPVPAPTPPAQDAEEAFDDIPPMPAYLEARDAPADHGYGGEHAAEPAPEPTAPPPRLAALGRRGGDMAAGIAASLAARRSAAQERKAADRARAETEAEAAREDERQRMTVFGARQNERAKREIGGKPRHLGLILSLVLLLFLAGVAAWASLFMDASVSRFFGPAPETEVAVLPADAPDELSAEGEEAMLPTPPGEAETAALADAPLPPLDDTALPQPLQPGLPHALTEKEAQARYAVTGVWQRAPQAPQLPDQLSLDDLYLTSIDPRVDAQDAVALPGFAALDTDAVLQDAPKPAQRGARFQFDDRGLVLASAAGTPSPEGFLVFAGRPARVPAALPQRLNGGGGDTATAEDDATRQRLAAKRPRSRPDGLIEQNERETLGGLTRTELAGKRPKARPELPEQKIEEETQEVGTEFAVAESRKPRPRPSNFATLVERSRETEQTTEPQATTQTAAAVPRAQATAPAAPSKANVAKAATVRNQLNLSKVNLIGVYGKPSSRRALVRLANGRYKKVQVGDRLDGGRVDAISDSELRYTRNGRSVTLRMPKG